MDKAYRKCTCCHQIQPHKTLIVYCHFTLLKMADPSTSLPLERSSVVAAHKLVKPHVHHTPVLTNTTLTNLASTPQTPEALVGTEWHGRRPAAPTIRLWFKCENLQKVGAFKVRGAFHALERLKVSEGNWEGDKGLERREKGVVTHSSGTCFLVLDNMWVD